MSQRIAVSQTQASQDPLATADTAEIEWDVLASALNQVGVLHVAPAHPHLDDVPHSARDLFTRLMRSTEPRLRQAVEVLLLTHPSWAAGAQEAIATLGEDERDLAMRRYVAAAALQRMARTRIESRLGPRPCIPAAYLDTLRLPPLEDEFGRATLFQLANDGHLRYGYDAWRTYHTLLDLFLAEMRRHGWGVICDSARIKPD